jgi:hypothetical protein
MFQCGVELSKNVSMESIRNFKYELLKMIQFFYEITKIIGTHFDLYHYKIEHLKSSAFSN